MSTLWENYSGGDLEPRKYISRISDSILQRMHGSGTQVYGAREFTINYGCNYGEDPKRFSICFA